MKQSRADLMVTFEITEAHGQELPPSWNVAPTDPVNMVRERRERPEAGRILETPRWGLVPPWAKDPKAGARAMNARIETVTEKPMFRKAALRHRGLIPANGYYEWQKGPGGSKTPIYLHPGAEDELLAFAALYEFWPDPSKAEDDPEKWLMTATIITQNATDSLGHIHDRCPVIVPRTLQEDWLDPDLTARADVEHLLSAMPEPHLIPREVSNRVNSVRNNGPELIEAVA